jgi:subtilisin family serine protease
MYLYLVNFDKNIHTRESATLELLSNGIVIVKEYNLAITFKVRTTEDKIRALNGVKSWVAEDGEVNQKMQYIDNYRDYLVSPDLDVTYDPVYTGKNVTIYILDTGINPGHQEFVSANIEFLYTNFVDFADNVGHGTAVSSIIVGQNMGIAPDANLVVVKLFDNISGNVTVGSIIEGLDAVYNHHASTDPTKTKIVCMPWTVDQNNFIDLNVIELNDNNLIVVCAAGNDGVDVNSKSPAGIEQVITVGAHNRNFEVTSFTNTPFTQEANFINYGSALDIFALGENVSVAQFNSLNQYILASGTSISTAIIAGVAAHYIEHDSNKTSSSLKEIILSEGHYWGLSHLVFDETGLNVDYSTVNRSVGKTFSLSSEELALTTSGRILNVKLGETGTVNIGLNSTATNVEVLDFAPTPSWIVFDATTGVITVDTATLASDMSPGIYIFAIKGQIAGKLKVEEYSVGVYTSSEDELTEDTSSYYYDADLDEYDEVITYQAASPVKA